MKDDSGQALVETAITLPVLALLIFGIIELASLYRQRYVVSYATFMAARCASVNPMRIEKVASDTVRVIVFGTLPVNSLSLIGGVIKTKVVVTNEYLDVDVDVPKRISSPIIAKTLTPLTNWIGMGSIDVYGNIKFPRFRTTPPRE